MPTRPAILNDIPNILRAEEYEYPTRRGLYWCFTGGRDFTDAAYVYNALDEIDDTLGIAALGVGCARGVDKFVREWAEATKVTWVHYLADWDRYGEGAGSMRNVAMLEDFLPDRLGVFPGGVGTTHCTRTARKMGIERTIFDPNPDIFSTAASWG